MSSLVNKLGLKIPGLPLLATILAVLMEVFWAFTVLAWISQVASWGHEPVNLISCLVLAVFTALLVRWSMNGKWSAAKTRWVVLPSVFILWIILVRWNLSGGFAVWETRWFAYAGAHIVEVIVASLFLIYLTWRGISVGRQENSFTSLYRRFLIGLVGIIFTLVLWGFSGDRKGDIWSGAGLEIVLFFGTGLLALAIANLETLRTELVQHQEATTSFSRRWLSMLIILVLAILGISLALAAVFSSDAGSTIAGILGTLGDWLLTAFIYLLYPIGFIAQCLYYVARYILSLLRGEVQPPEFQPSGPADWQKTLEGQSTVQIPDGVVLGLKIGAIVVVVGLVIFFLARMLTRYWQGKAEEGIEETHETLWSWKLFSMDLRSVFAWLFRWMHRRKKSADTPPEAVISALAMDKDNARLFTIRELYQALLWQGRETGTPRFSTETPYEYEKRLSKQRETISEELNNLTEAYIVDRYGQVAPEQEKVAWLNRVWRSLKAKFVKTED